MLRYFTTDIVEGKCFYVTFTLIPHPLFGRTENTVVYSVCPKESPRVVSKKNL